MNPERDKSYNASQFLLPEVRIAGSWRLNVGVKALFERLGRFIMSLIGGGE